MDGDDAVVPRWGRRAMAFSPSEEAALTLDKQSRNLQGTKGPLRDELAVLGMTERQQIAFITAQKAMRGRKSQSLACIDRLDQFIDKAEQSPPDEEISVDAVPKLPKSRSKRIETVEIWKPDGIDTWSPDRRRAWYGIKTNPDAYYLRFPKPGFHLTQAAWSDEELSRLAILLVQRPPNGKWGLFSLYFPTRTGIQCREQASKQKREKRSQSDGKRLAVSSIAACPEALVTHRVKHTSSDRQKLPQPETKRRRLINEEIHSGSINDQVIRAGGFDAAPLGVSNRIDMIPELVQSVECSLRLDGSPSSPIAENEVQSSNLRSYERSDTVTVRSLCESPSIKFVDLDDSFLGCCDIDDAGVEPEGTASAHVPRSLLRRMEHERGDLLFQFKLEHDRMVSFYTRDAERAHERDQVLQEFRQSQSELLRSQEIRSESLLLTQRNKVLPYVYRLSDSRVFIDRYAPRVMPSTAILLC